MKTISILILTLTLCHSSAAAIGALAHIATTPLAGGLLSAISAAVNVAEHVAERRLNETFNNATELQLQVEDLSDRVELQQKFSSYVGDNLPNILETITGKIEQLEKEARDLRKLQLRQRVLELNLEKCSNALKFNKRTFEQHRHHQRGINEELFRRYHHLNLYVLNHVYHK